MAFGAISLLVPVVKPALQLTAVYQLSKWQVLPFVMVDQALNLNSTVCNESKNLQGILLYMAQLFASM